MSGVASVPQVSKAVVLWSQWQDVHGSCTRAFSSAANILERVQVLVDAKPFEQLDQPDIQKKVLAKQMTSLNNSLGMLHKCHDELQAIVKDLERLHIEALRSLGSSATLPAHARPTGPEPTAVECTEMIHDLWVMCRDELLMKIAAVSLVRTDTSAADMAVLLKCYSDQPNVDADRMNKMFALLRETAPQQ